jgi:hypothetical protein
MRVGRQIVEVIRNHHDVSAAEAETRAVSASLGCLDPATAPAPIRSSSPAANVSAW